MMIVTDDNIYDLLQNPNRIQKLFIKKDLNKLVLIENLAEFVVEKREDCDFLINQGFASNSFSRTEPATIIFQFVMESRKANSKGLFMKSKINFIDLTNSGNSFLAFKSIITCLSNHSTASYKDSKLTQILSDSLNANSLNVMISIISSLQENAEKTLEALNFFKTFGKIEVIPNKNTLSCSSRTKPSLNEEILKLRNTLNSTKNGHENLWSLKQETDKLKKSLNKKTSIEEVEDLVKENKSLRNELQQLIGRPLAENDLEYPEMFQDALVLTEDLIKRRKLDLASTEMKEKLLKQGRCQICTLKLPCKHSDANAVAIINKPAESLELAIPKCNTPTFITGSDLDVPRKFRIRSCRGRGEVVFKTEEDKDEKIIKETQKRLAILNKIEVYREERLRKEIEKMENEGKMEKEAIEKKKAEEEKRRKYYEMQKEKILEYEMKKKKEEKEKEVVKEKRPQSHKIRSRPQSNVRIKDYEYKKSLVSEILKHQNQLIKNLKPVHEFENSEKVLDSVELLYNK